MPSVKWLIIFYLFIFLNWHVCFRPPLFFLLSLFLLGHNSCWPQKLPSPILFYYLRSCCNHAKYCFMWFFSFSYNVQIHTNLSILRQLNYTENNLNLLNQYLVHYLHSLKQELGVLEACFAAHALILSRAMSFLEVVVDTSWVWPSFAMTSTQCSRQ